MPEAELARVDECDRSIPRRETIRGTHWQKTPFGCLDLASRNPSWQRSCATATTDRTYDRKRSDSHEQTLATRGPSTYGSRLKAGTTKKKLRTRTQSTPFAMSSMVRLPRTRKAGSQENVLSGNAAASDRDQNLRVDAGKLPAQGCPHRMGRRQPAGPSDRLFHRRPVIRRRGQSLHRRHSLRAHLQDRARRP